jgi:hypothetical protein
MSWSFVESARFREHTHQLQMDVPVDVLLSLLMLARLYLGGQRYSYKN